ncbi:ribosome-associated protein, iojap-like protein [Salmonella enterica subsp. enterica serovar Heidelberg str. 84-1004]|nr:hypothetical protein SEEH4496_10508 [Salmonella enterica subsp. enterica serovar Heidelberg str. N4496]KJU14604.1 ribosome-associated protein, iojap-like protein [Salmonella enterica subsp. enterica serovar Heidelberg str. 84-1004]
MNFPFFLAAAVSPIDSPRQAVILRSQAFFHLAELCRNCFTKMAMLSVTWDGMIIWF